MPQIIVEGIAVDFPKEPYPCQIDYMQSNIRAIIGKENALLESPTGTGKTLSLLCSTLAWQRMAKANKRTMSLAYNSGPSVSANALKGGKDAPPKISNSPMIIYATRTHSQLSQVVSELRSTAYKPKTSVLGSREQLCIHEKISKFRGGVLNHNCSVTSAQGRCSFKNNLSSYDGADVILDIEELVKLGKSQSICPYFFSRDVTAKADIVLLPYNYLLDSTIRSTMESIIDWQDAVIIFDEAHNVERVASDAASCSLSSTDVANTILELKQTLQLLRDEVDLNPLLKGTMEKTSEVIQKPKLETVASLLKGLFAFERHVANVNVERGSIGQNSSATFGGEWLRKSFETVGFPCSGIQCKVYLEELRRCSNYLIEKKQQSSLDGPSLSTYEPKVMSFFRLYARICSSYHYGNEIDYKVYINEEQIRKNTTSFNRSESTGNTTVNKTKRIINYWAFSPGIAMLELKALGVRSIILTSGTLSPMDALKEDMKLPFNIQLENPHVIEDNQMFVTALANGSTGKTLNSSYNNRDSSSYKDELGISILQICQTMLSRGGVDIPKGRPLRGGILIFFPSYGVMDNAIERWKATGVYEKIKSIYGALLVEPKAGTIDQDKSFIESGSSKVSNKNIVSTEDSGGEYSYNDVVGKFEHAIGRYGGCVLMAVCRGKVSEGIDFSDQKGRVVIVTGIPFAPHFDPWVTLKRQYLDDRCNRGSGLNKMTATISKELPHMGSSNKGFGWSEALSINANASQISSAYPPEQKLNLQSRLDSSLPPYKLNGQTWYNQSALRAVNQCLGRVIRHKRDWGAVFLLDERTFVENNLFDRLLGERQIQQLSRWIRPKLKKVQHFSVALKEFRGFLDSAMTNPELYPTSLIEQEIRSESVKRDDGTASGIISIPTRMPLPKSNNNSKEFVKQVTLDYDDNYHDNVGSFINPELLFSQPPLGKQAAFDTTERTIRSQGHVVSERGKTNKLEFTRKSFGLPERTEIKDLGNFCSSGSQSCIEEVKSSSRISQKDFEDTLSSSLFQAVESPVEDCAKETSTYSGSSISFKCLHSSQSLSQKTEKNTNSLKSVIAKLKPQLDTSELSLLRHTLSGAKEFVLSEKSEIDSFVSSITSCLAGVSKTMYLEACKSFSFLVSPNSYSQSYYIKRVGKISNSMMEGSSMKEVSESSDNKNDNVERTRLEKRLIPSDSDSFSLLSSTKSDIGSKRAKIMIERIQDRKGNVNSSHVKPKINVADLGKISLCSTKKVNSMSSFSARGTCNICNELTDTAYAAKCGHIMCKTCWTQWLRVKESCPVCRAPASYQNIAKIVFKK